MSARGSKEVRLVLGASPRVDLLPPEVGDRKKGAAVRRSIALGVVGALVLSAGLYAFAGWQAIEAEAKLDTARSETSALLAKQAEFSEVRALSAQLETATAARQVGASTEINWSSFYTSVATGLPAGVTIASFAIDSSSPSVALSPVTVATRNPRVATATFTLRSPNLPTIAAWLVALKSVPGYVDATATPASIDDAGTYESLVTMNVSDAIYSKRFAPTEEPAAEASTETVTEESN